jgi:hypothetical protein
MNKKFIKMWIKMLRSGKFVPNAYGFLQTVDHKYSAAGIITEKKLGLNPQVDGDKYKTKGNWTTLGYGTIYFFGKEKILKKPFGKIYNDGSLIRDLQESTDFRHCADRLEEFLKSN